MAGIEQQGLARVLTVDFICHGETKRDPPDRVPGAESRRALLPDRVRDVIALAEKYRVAKISVLAIYAPKWAPAWTTAMIMNEALEAGPEPIERSDLADLSRGNFQGMLLEEAYTPEVKGQMLRQGAGYCFPGGDSRNDTSRRMMRVLSEIRRASSRGLGRILCISYPESMKCLMSTIQGTLEVAADFSRVQLANLGIMRVTYNFELKRWELVGWNLLHP